MPGAQSIMRSIKGCSGDISTPFLSCRGCGDNSDPGPGAKGTPAATGWPAIVLPVEEDASDCFTKQGGGQRSC